MEVYENIQQARVPRSTQNKTPARYVLTPTPPQRRLTNVSQKHFKTHKKIAGKTVVFLSDAASSGIVIGPSSQRHLSNITSEDKFGSVRHRHRSSSGKTKQNHTKKKSKCRRMTDGAAEGISSNNNESQTSDDVITEEVASENENDLMVTSIDEAESQEETTSDDENPDAQYRSKEVRKTLHRIENEEDLSGAEEVEQHCQEEYLEQQFTQLRSDLDVATNKLFQQLNGKLERFDKHMKEFSKRIQSTTTNQHLDIYRRDNDQFPDIIEYNGKNLLGLHSTGDCGRYARQLLKMIFTVDELSDSILYPNPTYAKPGLDQARMILFKDAMCARFRISSVHWDEFFNCVLRRSLTQFLCDTRRKTKLKSKSQLMSNE